MRLNELRHFNNLADRMTLQRGRCHEMKGNRKGQLSVDLKHPLRLIFEPDHDPVPKKADGGLDLVRITKVVIIEYTDPHE